MNVELRMAGPADLDRVRAAHDAWGYRGGFHSGDVAWVAELAGQLVGAVRIVEEHGLLVLRGMRVAEPFRRGGIGTRMLREAARWLGARDCYCVPFAHLVDFYKRHGFQEIPLKGGPAFLETRSIEYRKQGLDVILMRRMQ